MVEALEPVEVAAPASAVVVEDVALAELLAAALIADADALRDVADRGGDGVSNVAEIAANEESASSVAEAYTLVRVDVLV